MRYGSCLSLADGLMATCVPGFILECGADTGPGLEGHRQETLACNPRGSPSLRGPELMSTGWNDLQLVGGSRPSLGPCCARFLPAPREDAYPLTHVHRGGRLLKACLSVLNTFALKAKTYVLASRITEPVPYSRV